MGSYVGDGVGSYVGDGVGSYVGDGVGSYVGDGTNEKLVDADGSVTGSMLLLALAAKVLSGSDQS